MSDNAAVTLGQSLRALRLKAGLSLRALAKAAKVSAPFLSDVELGRRFPTNETLALISKRLRVASDELKKHDHRSGLADLKRWAEGNQELAAAVRALADKVNAGVITPAELARKLRDITPEA